MTVAILADKRLTDRQRRVLLDVYRSFVSEDEGGPDERPGDDSTAVLD